MMAAYQIIMFGRNTAGAAAPSYVGPGDVVSGALAFWGLRAYSAATIGGNCVRLQRSSDSAQQDFVTLADGSLDVASIATWAGANDLGIVKLYDQTGNGKDFDDVLAALSNQARLLLATLGSLPVMRDGAFNPPLKTTATISQAQPYTLVCVGNQITDPGGVASWLTSAGNPSKLAALATMLFVQDSSAGWVLTAPGTLPVNTWHTMIGVFNGVGAASKAAINGTITNGGTVGAGALSGVIETPFAGNGMEVNLATEFGIWPAAFSNQNIADMDANQRAYWSF